MKNRMGLVAIGYLLLSCCDAQAQKNYRWEERFVATKKYLRIPVKNGAKERQIELFQGEQRLRWFDVELAEDTADWFAYVNIEPWMGKELSLKLDSGSKAPEGLSVVQSATDTNAGVLYAEKYRGQFHFSAKRGWNNDPNGLVYYNGEYHLFFQYNPYALKPGNMAWGHATSKDLVHWKEHEIALFPDKTGIMFSGSGVVDEKNTSGLGKNGTPPMLLFYTAAVDTWSQGAAFSLDGRNFKKLPKPVLGKIIDGNRDPKVIWHEPTQKWVMVLFALDENRQNVMFFYRSSDLKNWEFASKTMGGIGGDRYLHECPEFYEIAVEGKPQIRKWILTGGNGEYAIGSFDGKTFKPEKERLSYQYGRGYYAAQTFNNAPGGRRIEMGWWQPRTNIEGMTFNQSMSVPAELKLVDTPKGLRLQRKPVVELKVIRKQAYVFPKQTLTSETLNPLKDIRTELAELKLVIEPKDAEGITMEFRGLTFRYNVREQEIMFDETGIRVPAPLDNGKFDLHCYVDRTGMEFFVNNGLAYIPLPLTYLPFGLKPENNSYNIRADKGEAVVHELEVYELGGIWP